MRVLIRAVDVHPTRPTDRETIASIIASIARTRPVHTPPLSATICGDEVTSADSEARISLGIRRHHDSFKGRTSIRASLKRSSMEGHRHTGLGRNHRHRISTARPSSSATIDPTSGSSGMTLAAQTYVASPTIRMLTRTDGTIGAASCQVGISKAAIGPAKPGEAIGLCIGPRTCQVHEVS